MDTRIYVGNLPWSVDDNELLLLFSKFGNVAEAKVITERETGRSRGFGFVKMSQEAAEEAIRGLNGYEHKGRPLTVNVARERSRDDNNKRRRRDGHGKGR